MLSDALEQLSRDDAVVKKFEVPLSSLQIVKHPNGGHLLKYSTIKAHQAAQLSLADVFAISHGKSSDILQLLAFLKVPGHYAGGPAELLRLGIFQFKAMGMSATDGKETDSFLAIYEELVHIIDSQNHDRNMPKKLLLFVNPHSGENMRAFRIFSRYVSPLLKLASVSFKVIVMTFPSNPLKLDAEHLGTKWLLPPGAVELTFDYPFDYCFNNNVEDYDGIVSVSGDGTLSDVILGMLKRKYGEIKPTTELQRFEKPTFGIVGAGSTDSMALTIYGTSDPLTAVLHVISGSRVGIDVQGLFDSPAGFHPENENYSLEDSKLKRFSFNGVGGGGFLPKLIDISKDIRSVFKANRFNAAAVPLFLANKPTPLTVYYKAAPTQPKSLRTFCSTQCKRCLSFANHSACNMTLSAASVAWNKAHYDHYLSVLIGSNAVLSRYQPHGLSPHCHLGDGTADLVLQKHQPTLFHYLNLHRKANTLSHDMYDLTKEGLDFVRVWEYSVEPKETGDGGANQDTSHNGDNLSEPKLLCSSDGELFRCRRLHGIVYCQLFRMFGCGRAIPATAK